jgi:tetratricopeptide (TPR) repeat protein
MLANRFLLLCLLAALGPIAQADTSCRADEVQQLLIQKARAEVTVTRLLAACARVSSLDFHTLMMLGAVAREQGHLDQAADFFGKAHRLTPHDVAATLELAVTEEWRRDPQAARGLYQTALAANPASRPALLGLARVARAQYRLAEARGIYARLLQADPQDIEARNGMAWVALADKQLDDARNGFQAVLGSDPENAEARDGLSGVAHSWPYLLDLNGGLAHTPAGKAWSGSASLHVDLDATSTLEVGAYHYTNELPTVQLTEQTPLPSNDIRLGYYVRVPDSYNWALIYDYRDHDNLPTEHWLEARLGDYVIDRLQWFASVRQSFGAAEWDSRLVQAGLVVPLATTWEIVPTVYFQQAKIQRSPTTFQGERNLFAYGLDLNRQGPGNSFFNVGAGYSPDISNVDLHTRWVFPIGPQASLLVSVEHVSVNHEYQASIGWRYYWR